MTFAPKAEATAAQVTHWRNAVVVAYGASGLAFASWVSLPVFWHLAAAGTVVAVSVATAASGFRADVTPVAGQRAYSPDNFPCRGGDAGGELCAVPGGTEGRLGT